MLEYFRCGWIFQGCISSLGLERGVLDQECKAGKKSLGVNGLSTSIVLLFSHFLLQCGHHDGYSLETGLFL